MSPKGSGIFNLQYIVSRKLSACQIAAGVSLEVPGAHGRAIQRAKYLGLHPLRHFLRAGGINRKSIAASNCPQSEELAAAERALLG